MYLTEIPELQQTACIAAVNVYLTVNQWDATFEFFRHY